MLILGAASCSPGNEQQGPNNATNVTSSAGSDDAAFSGDWSLIATDVDGVRVYIDAGSIRPAGIYKVADLAFVGASGRRLMRDSFGCLDQSANSVTSVGDENVEFSGDLVGDLHHEPGEHAVADYVCGRAKIPPASLHMIPPHL